MNEIDNVVEKRREKTVEILVSKGIHYCKYLPIIDNYKIYKSETQIGKRFIASLIFSLRACDYFSDKKFFQTESKEITESAIARFKLARYLFPDEIEMLGDDCDEQTLVRVSWEIECCHALAWVLGLVSTEDMVNNVVEEKYNNLFALIQSYNSFDEFKRNCKMRSHSEILDMLDLYYNYHWVCVEKRLRPDTESGGLNEEIVMERRRALEWLICRDKTWDDISLDT